MPLKGHTIQGLTEGPAKLMEAVEVGVGEGGTCLGRDLAPRDPFQCEEEAVQGMEQSVAPGREDGVGWVEGTYSLVENGDHLGDESGGCRDPESGGCLGPEDGDCLLGTEGGGCLLGTESGDWHGSCCGSHCEDCDTLGDRSEGPRPVVFSWGVSEDGMWAFHSLIEKRFS